MEYQNKIVHEHPHSIDQATIPIPENGEAAVDKMRIIACHIDPTGLVIDQRISIGFFSCHLIETAAGHTFTTNMRADLRDVQA